VKTFTMGFLEAEHDEAPHARAVAAHLGTDHEEMLVTPAEAQAVIPMLPDIYDEPFADPSQVPTYLVAKLARRRVTVSLSGDAGDELFGGYNRYVWARNASRALGWMPRPARRVLSAAVRAVPARAWGLAMRAAGPLAPRVARAPGAGGRLHRLAEVATFTDVRELYVRLVSLWDAPDGLVVSGREPATRLMTAMREGVAWRDLAEQLAYLDFVTYLPDDILVKVDRACMAVSLESRVPLLDHRVVELAASVPPSMKLRRGRGKWLLRQVLARHVPPALTERPKAGFGMPVDEWLRGPLRPWAEDLLDEARLKREGFLEPAPIRAAWAEHLSGARSHQYRLWAVLMFQAWLQRWS
jgi:asparagine synthase (glutamine-hydrolysing)